MATKNIDIVLENVLRKIIPSEQEKNAVHSVIEDVLAETERIIRPLGLSVVLAGSFTRNTWLSHKKEFDIFIQFPVETSRENLEKMGLELGKKIVKSFKGTHVIAYAEHPYVRSRIKGYDVDIVPCYKVESAEKIKSAVDRTPFHNQYLSKKFHPHQSNDVRLLKTFCKINGLYGSDLKTQGFSGYLCELLIIAYDDFKNFLKESSKWIPGQMFIDLEGRYKGAGKEFSSQVLVLIDPVDPKRNVAAALSPAVFVKFVKLVQQFLKTPSTAFFEKKDVKVNKLALLRKIKSRETSLLAITFKRPDIVDDIIYPQLRKTSKRLIDVLKEYEFSCIGQTSWTDEKRCLILIEVEKSDLPNIRRVVGPPVFAVKNSKDFVEKYKTLGRVWIEEGRWLAEVPREFRNARRKLTDTLSAKTDTLKAKGLATHMADSLAKGFKVLDANQVLKTANQDLLKTLENYFEEDLK